MAAGKTQKKLPAQEDPAFEIELDSTLKPVQPDPRFVESLHHRLITIPEIGYEPAPTSRERLLAAALVILVAAWILAVAKAISRFFCRCP